MPFVSQQRKVLSIPEASVCPVQPATKAGLHVRHSQPLLCMCASLQLLESLAKVKPPAIVAQDERSIATAAHRRVRETVILLVEEDFHLEASILCLGP